MQQRDKKPDHDEFFFFFLFLDARAARIAFVLKDTHAAAAHCVGRPLAPPFPFFLKKKEMGAAHASNRAMPAVFSSGSF